ncbi:unnamed protein product [Rhizophagus irregularis]|nr:unnamed protein product [Rhizophagus irregularis]CAB5304753.1 unnamed protein product [Rhizophagus irregularis]
MYSAQSYDKIQWITSYILQTYNVPETYKNKSSLKRMENSEKKSQKRKSNTTKKTNRMTKKQKTTISNIDNSYDSRNALRESNLPNRQQQKDILEFEKERNKILKERLKKKLLELGGN